MKIIIDIPKGTYQNAQEIYEETADSIWLDIANGTPLTIPQILKRFITTLLSLFSC